jgi:putative acetyltransferase
MTGLVRHAVETCFAFNIDRIYVDASICIRPLFEKTGFKVIRENRVTINGIQLLNFKMELLK